MLQKEMRFVSFFIFVHSFEYPVILYLASIQLQFGYFSFGGSTVICVFEKV